MELGLFFFLFVLVYCVVGPLSVPTYEITITNGITIILYYIYITHIPAPCVWIRIVSFDICCFIQSCDRELNKWLACLLHLLFIERWYCWWWWRAVHIQKFVIILFSLHTRYGCVCVCVCIYWFLNIRHKFDIL